MFADLRKKSGSLVIYLMFAAIIVTFVISFGPGDQGCRAQPNWVAMVNGDTITQSEFRFVFNNYYDFYQRMIPEFNAQKAKEMNLSKSALDGLVEVMLLAQKAEDLGFAVTDEEIRREITETPYFLKGEAFDRDQYTRFVQFQMGMTIAAYEEKVRRDLFAEKLRRFLTDSADVSESEISQEFINNNESIDAQFLVISESRMKPEAREKIAQSVEEKEIAELLAKDEARAKSFLADNKERWRKDDGTERPFDEVKSDIARELIVKDRIAALVKAEAAKALSLFSGGSYKPELLKKDFPDWDLAVQEQTAIKRTARYIPDIGISADLVKSLFSLP
ncbi:MAG TPA: SurA N-terminal domain-containing protein, partial [bacterium]|nr:SurA N-terminal domain-containing protein [bacterium]